MHFKSYNDVKSRQSRVGNKQESGVHYENKKSSSSESRISGKGFAVRVKKSRSDFFCLLSRESCKDYLLSFVTDNMTLAFWNLNYLQAFYVRRQRLLSLRCYSVGQKQSLFKLPLVTG